MFFFTRCTAPELSPPPSPPKPKKIDPLTTHLRNLVCVLAGRTALLRIDLGNIERAPEPTDQRAKARNVRTITTMKEQTHRMDMLFEQIHALLLSVPLEEISKGSTNEYAPLSELIKMNNDQLLQYLRTFVDPFLVEPPTAACAAFEPAAE